MRTLLSIIGYLWITLGLVGCGLTGVLLGLRRLPMAERVGYFAGNAAAVAVFCVLPGMLLIYLSKRKSRPPEFTPDGGEEDSYA